MREIVGEAVALVAMFDTYNFSLALKPSFSGLMLQRIRFHLENFARLGPNEMAKYVREKVRVLRDGELTRLISSIPGSSKRGRGSSASPATETSVQAINDRAGDEYVPKPYSGRLTIFKPDTNYKFYPDPKMGWEGLASGGLDIVELSMNPHAMLLEPFVRTLALELKGRIDASSDFTSGAQRGRVSATIEETAAT